ncbi:MAG: alpha/beta fold hydrolase [Bacteroidia bacterium]|nr:alpha/beta fold hydrolase [Bacteroidia bacterium]
MPVIDSTFRPPIWLKNGHTQTIWPALTRKVNAPDYVRERIELPDGDFVDLDWSRIGSRRLAVVLHGLEASAYEHYIMALVNALNKRGWDVLAMNFRSCSGEPNRKWSGYHSGHTIDLHHVINLVLEREDYDTRVLAGFSLGGNVSLKYAGEQGEALLGKLDAVAAVSVPIHLSSCAAKIGKTFGGVYNRRFLGYFKEKLQTKAHLAPDPKIVDQIMGLTLLTDFDDLYTGPVHGFKDGEDYYQKSSSSGFLEGIKIPTLLLNALDDPFLTDYCFPKELAPKTPHFYLEVPIKGGHVGFVPSGSRREYWTEKRVPDFFAEILGLD